MVKKNNKTYLWIALIIVAIADAFSSTLGVIPIIGDLFSSVSNLIWEVIELALVFGLLKKFVFRLRNY